MRITPADRDILIDALRNSLQDTLDYAEPKDYEDGELETSVSARVAVLKRLGGTTDGISGANGYLLEEAA